MNNLGPADLQTTIEQMDRDLAALVPTLPPEVIDDGRIVQRAMLALTEQLARSGWSLAAPEMQSQREDIATGQGPFAGFPDAMARAVDRECG